MIFDQFRAIAKSVQGRQGLPGATRDYPAYKAPHDTGGPFLGVEKLKHNLAHFLEHRCARRQRITVLLQSKGLNPEPAMTFGKDPYPFLSELDSWVTESWRDGYISRQQLSRQFWTMHCDDGTVSMYGFLSDIGLLMGEILLAQRPTCRWGFDVMARNREHSSFVNRPVIAGLAVPADKAAPSFYDPVQSAFYALRTVRYHPEPGAHDLTTNVRARLSYYPLLNKQAQVSPAKVIEHAW